MDIFVYSPSRIYRVNMTPISPTLTQEVCMMEAELCSAFSDPTRILILYELDERPRTVSDLTVDLNLSQPTISRHLKTLRDRGLVVAERHGTTMLYRLTDRRLIDALDLLRAVMRDRLLRRANLISEMQV
jgi:DNA-binding transcriptional ArsR family regulator